jgi:hypothetical protein
MHKKFAPEVPTTDRFMETVTHRVPCKRHQKEAGFPCWHIVSDGRNAMFAVCNWRAKKAGFNGKISGKSLSRTRPQHYKKK